MSDLRNLTRDFLREFIELYRSYPCLWKTKSKDYLDKNMKNAAYNILLEKLKVVQPEAIKNTVVQKINSLRGGFRREFKKVKDSKRSGTGADDVYVPTLWYYHLLEFVKDQEAVEDSVSNVPGDDNSSDFEASEHVDDQNSNGENDNDVENEYSPETPDACKSGQTILPPISTPSKSICGNNRGARKRKNCTQTSLSKSDEILSIVGEKLNTLEDEFNILGKYVATKLRKMPRETQLYTGKLINDLLFKAELGQINQYTTISTSRPIPPTTNNTISTFDYPQPNTSVNRSLVNEYSAQDLDNNNYPNFDSNAANFYSRFSP